MEGGDGVVDGVCGVGATVELEPESERPPRVEKEDG